MDSFHPRKDVDKGVVGGGGGVQSWETGAFSIWRTCCRKWWKGGSQPALRKSILEFVVSSTYSMTDTTSNQLNLLTPDRTATSCSAFPSGSCASCFSSCCLFAQV